MQESPAACTVLDIATAGARLESHTSCRSLLLRETVWLRWTWLGARASCPPSPARYRERSCNLGGRQLLFQQLPLVQTCVLAAKHEQLFVRAPLDDPAFVEHANQIGIAHG